MAVIQLKTKDILHPFSALAGTVDLVIAWNKTFTDSSGTVTRGELRTPLTRVSGNRWRIPALNLWTSFDLTIDPGVLFSAWFECDGKLIEWPELRQFHLNVPPPVTTYEELISVERWEERGLFSAAPLAVRRDPRSSPDTVNTVLVIGPEHDAYATPITLRFGNGEDAPFLRFIDNAFTYSLDGRTILILGSGGGGGLTAELPVRSINANGTLAPSADGLLLVNTAAGPVVVTVNNPTAGQRNTFYIKKTTTDENSITLTPASGQIDGAANYQFSGAQLTTGNGVIIAFDGTNWHVFPS